MHLISCEFQIEGEGPPVAGPPVSTTNVVMNPAWPPQGVALTGNSGGKPRLTSRLSQMSLRSTVSDTELEQVCWDSYTRPNY